jgi:hypothetical protein
MRPPGLAPASDPAFRKPLSASPLTTQMTGGGLARHGTRRSATHPPSAQTQREPSGEPLPAAMGPYRACKSVRYSSAHQAPSFSEPYRATGEISFASR